MPASKREGREWTGKRPKGRKGWERGKEEWKRRGGRAGEGRLASHTIFRPCNI